MRSAPLAALFASLLKTSPGFAWVHGGPAQQCVAPSAPRLGRTTVTRAAADEAGGGGGVRTLALSELTVDRFLGEVSFTTVATFDAVVTPDAPATLATPVRATARLFQGSLRDPAIRSRGGDPRVLLKELGSGSSGSSSSASPRRGAAAVARLAEAELAAAAALEAEWTRRRQGGDAGGGGVGGLFAQVAAAFGGGAQPEPKPYAVLLGELTVPSGPGFTAAIDAADWVDQLGTVGPRPGARWLVYEYDGRTSLASFAEPTAARVGRAQAQRAAAKAAGAGGGLGLPPLPDAVSWGRAAAFLASGVWRQSLEGLALLHDAGVAHRALDGNALVLSATGSFDKGTPLQQCDPALLRVKLSNLAFGSPLADAQGRDRADAARRWLGPRPPLSSAGPAGPEDAAAYGAGALASLAVAEDLHSLGLALLHATLAVLAEPHGHGDAQDGSGGAPLSAADVARLVERTFAGDGARGFPQLQAYLEADPRLARASCELLAQDRRAGWELLALMCTAREATGDKQRLISQTSSSNASSEGGPAVAETLVRRSARALAGHRFFKANSR